MNVVELRIIRSAWVAQVAIALALTIAPFTAHIASGQERGTLSMAGRLGGNNPDRWNRPPYSAIRPGDEIWFIGSRHLSNSDIERHRASLDMFRVRKSVHGRWHNSTWNDFLAAHRTELKSTVVFIHGNRTDADRSQRQCWETYEALIGLDLPVPSLRLIVFDWPSDKICGPLRDIRVKARLAKHFAFYYAQLLQRLDNGRPLGTIGYSYGGRMSVHAMHLLAGGAVDGQKLVNSSYKMNSPVRVALIVPAIRNDSLFCCSPTGRSYGAADEIIVTYNSQDPLLRFYRLLAFDQKRPALGYTGVMRKACLPDNGKKLTEFDAQTGVGADHSYFSYVNSRGVPEKLRKTFFDAVQDAVQ